MDQSENKIPILESHLKENPKSKRPRHVKDVVCPVCYKPVDFPTMGVPVAYRYNKNIRRYFCWCEQCHAGYEVYQFERDGRWVIHKYQIHQTRAAGQAVTLNELPEAPVVLTGPGGVYDIEIDPNNGDLMPAIETMWAAFKAAQNTVECLLKVMIQKTQTGQQK